MGRPRLNKGPCSTCNEDAAWTKQLCKACYKRFYYAQNKESEGEYRRLHNRQNLSKIAKRKRERERVDINYKLINRLRSRLNHAIRRGHALKNLGCSIDELKLFLETKFQPGMSWSNYGDWHIDHIRPLCSFDLTQQEALKEAGHFSNLQPLWARDNLRKGAKNG
jgi:hypothetical protein